MSFLFTHKLKLDEQLTLAGPDLPSYMNHQMQPYVAKNISSVDKLAWAGSYPTPYEFAALSHNAYKIIEDLSQLPPGWKFLTCSETTSGYFGRAYWRPDYQQVVIAHRGTKSLADLKADVQGVLLNQFVPHMSSAATFVYRIQNLLDGLEKKMGFRFQLFFTGHSLGGWLAQITAFTVKYLKVVDSNFQINENHKIRGYHAQAVVFDSLGCKDMLVKMKNLFDVRYREESIFLKDLDIVSYLSAPNLANTYSMHVGRVYRVFFDQYKNHNTWINWLNYCFETHTMNGFISVIDRISGHFKEGRLKEIIDWPIWNLRIPFIQSNEYDNIFKWANVDNKYHPDSEFDEFTEVELQNKREKYPIRYQTKQFEGHKCMNAAFTKVEQEFLKSYQLIRNVPELLRPTNLFESIPNAEDYLESIKIDQSTVCCKTSEKLLQAIPYVKRLLQLFPEIESRVREFSTQDNYHKMLYLCESKRTIERIEMSNLDIPKSGFWNSILAEEKIKILEINVNEDPLICITMLYRSLTKQLPLKSSLFLELGQLLKVNQIFSFEELLLRTDINLAIVECKQVKSQEKTALMHLLQGVERALKFKSNIKLIFVSDQKSLLSNFYTSFCEFKSVYIDFSRSSDQQIYLNKSAISDIQKRQESHNKYSNFLVLTQAKRCAADFEKETRFYLTKNHDKLLFKHETNVICNKNQQLSSFNYRYERANEKERLAKSDNSRTKKYSKIVQFFMKKINFQFRFRKKKTSA